jgi:hypothetical protein
LNIEKVLRSYFVEIGCDVGGAKKLASILSDGEMLC